MDKLVDPNVAAAIELLYSDNPGSAARLTTLWKASLLPPQNTLPAEKLTSGHSGNPVLAGPPCSRTISLR